MELSFSQDGRIAASNADTTRGSDVITSSSLQADGMEDVPEAAQEETQKDMESSPAALDFSSLFAVCTARQAFNGRQDPALGVETSNNFVKGASFSPDGTCLLTSSEDTVLRVFEVPNHALSGSFISMLLNDFCGIARFLLLYWCDRVWGKKGIPSGATTETGSSTTSGTREDWSPCLSSVEGETIYDFAWYPHMTSAEPATSVFVSTSRDHPLHMWDAFTGTLRATYRAYDHVDEVVAANSVCFNTSGDKIFAGYNRMIRVFDVAQPGRSFEARPTCKTRKSKTGQRGIISSLAFSPDSCGGGLFAAGSYAKTICLYSENSRGRAVAELATSTMGGVTHLKFSPDGRSLFSGSRKDADIVCWDIRRTKEVLCTFRRQAETNQRIAFDVDPSGRYLATGSTERQALVYDIGSQALIRSLDNQPDAVGSVCFHPYAALLGVCTGQRHFALDTDAGSDSDGSIDSARPRGDGVRGGSPTPFWRNGVTTYGIGRLSSEAHQ